MFIFCQAGFESDISLNFKKKTFKIGERREFTFSDNYTKCEYSH